jgi:hypothetical protein
MRQRRDAGALLGSRLVAFVFVFAIRLKSAAVLVVIIRSI